MSEVLIFAGTSEGRSIAEFLVSGGIPVHVCVATSYGETLLPSGADIGVTSRRLQMKEMILLIEKEKSTLVVDATHPYAVEVSKNIKQACVQTGVEYIRVVRGSEAGSGSLCIYKESMEQAVAYLTNTTGNVLVTTGSKELKKFTALKEYRTRIFARVLSTPEVVTTCADMGFQGNNLICMQGPFCEELNYAMLKQINAKYLVTKECGIAGGFQEKEKAAARAGAQMIVVGRPEEQPGITLEQSMEMLRQRFHIAEQSRQATVVTHGVSDDLFVRGAVPMTKEEIRGISISKLQLTKDAVVYDVGAGTGSVAVEIALQVPEGMVYAVEQKSEGVELIIRNKEKFKVDNLMVVSGSAPAAMESLPVPTHAFIGGSSGNLRKIMELLLKKNPTINMVINAITLETMTQILECVKALPVNAAQVVHVSVARSQIIGAYHMMKAENPVYIVSCKGEVEQG